MYHSVHSLICHKKRFQNDRLMTLGGETVCYYYLYIVSMLTNCGWWKGVII